MATTKSDGGGKPLPRKLGPPPTAQDRLKKFPKPTGPEKTVPRGPFFGSDRKAAAKADKKVFVPTKKLDATQVKDRRGKGHGSYPRGNPWEVGKPQPGAPPNKPTVPKKGMGGH